jgi:hypothetical protein
MFDCSLKTDQTYGMLIVLINDDPGFLVNDGS